jgi:hypothetical protein
MGNFSELNYFRATVREEYVDAKGKTKYRKDQYIVNAISPTDVEAKIAKKLSDVDYELVSVNLTTIVDIIN